MKNKKSGGPVAKKSAAKTAGNGGTYKAKSRIPVPPRAGGGGRRGVEQTEPQLVERSIYCPSPAAWEIRENREALKILLEKLKG